MLSARALSALGGRGEFRGLGLYPGTHSIILWVWARGFHAGHSGRASFHAWHGRIAGFLNSKKARSLRIRFRVRILVRVKDEV